LFKNLKKALNLNFMPMKWKAVSLKNNQYHDFIVCEKHFDKAYEMQYTNYHLRQSGETKPPPKTDLVLKDFDSYILFDLPGSIMMDRHLYVFELENLKIKVPATDLSYFYYSAFLPLLEIEDGLKSVQRFCITIYFDQESLEELCSQMKSKISESLILTKQEDLEFERRIKEIERDRSPFQYHENKFHPIGLRKDNKKCH
jgi:hypothetical protein